MKKGMKKGAVILLSLAMSVSLAACGGGVDTTESASESEISDTKVKRDPTKKPSEEPSSTVAERTSEAPSSSAHAPSEIVGTIPASEGVDLDLTKMSSTMVYSEVYNIMQKPDAYIGKIIKMNGTFTAFETPARNYYSCIIKDATACCQKGIEFIWGGDHSYPSDYPEENQEIVVTGRFETYDENGTLYCQLNNAIVEF